jgi:ubiquinone/menaquinone biosynthesis C-methylase UbiE
MRNNSTHSMFPQATAEEQAQQNFIKSLRVFTTRNFHAGNKALLREKLLPEQTERTGSTAMSRREVRLALGAEPHNQWWSAMMRTTQEMLYDTVGPSIERQLPQLIDKARAARGKVGSLRLNPDIQIPRYATALDYHCKPGNYHTERMADDVFAGAEFDRTYRLYSMGGLGANLDGAGHTLIAWMSEHFPDFKPTRILDMGCTVGHSTGAYCIRFPDAEVHAIDIAAPCLRYGHARAVAMDYPIHFSQQVAERTDFEDESFDLIVSHVLMHETTHKAIREIYRECYRLLKPGGLMIHLDVITPDDLYGKYHAEWMAHFNNEPYFGTVQDEDFQGICTQAGFTPERITIGPANPQYSMHQDDGRSVNVYLAVCGQK